MYFHQNPKLVNTQLNMVSGLVMVIDGPDDKMADVVGDKEEQTAGVANKFSSMKSRYSAP